MDRTLISFLKKFFFLFIFVLLVSCDGRDCVQAEDFGEYDTDSVVALARNSNCIWNDSYGSINGEGDYTIKSCIDGSGDGNGIDLSPGITVFNTYILSSNTTNSCITLYNCANNDNCLGSYEYDGTTSTTTDKITIECVNGTVCLATALSNNLPENYDPNNDTGGTLKRSTFENMLKSILIQAYEDCKSLCIADCNSQPSTFSSLYEADWSSTTTMEESDGITGITIKPSKTITIEATGDISLYDSAEAAEEILLTNKYLQPTSLTFKQNESINFLLGGQGCSCGTSTNCSLINSCSGGDQIGEFFNVPYGNNQANLYNINRVNTSGRTEFLRRAVIYLQKYPEGYRENALGESIGIPLNFDTTAWSCAFDANTNITNTLHAATCTTDYSQTQYFQRLATSNEISNNDITTSNTIYKIEDTANKTIGGTVIPTANLSDISNPFSNVYCTTTNNYRKCTVGENAENTFENSDTGIIIANQNNYQNSAVINTNKAVKLAFKILGDTPANYGPNGKSCLVSINFDGTTIVNKLEINSSDGWVMPNNGQTINENSTFLNPLDKPIVITVENSANSTNTTTKCGQGFAIRVFKLNEITVENSGFVDFKIADNPIGSVNGCDVNFDIINPTPDISNIGNEYSQFYEYPNITQTVNVPVGSWSRQRIFVRKGQVLRFNHDSWERLTNNEIQPITWNSTIDLRQCGVGMLMRIEKRPALLCKGKQTENIIDSSCTKLTNEETGTEYCKGFPSKICTLDTNTCQLGCVKDTSGNTAGPSCTNTSLKHSVGDLDSNNALITLDTCNQCTLDITTHESKPVLTQPIIVSQCYNLENYTGRVANINETTNSTDLFVDANGKIEIETYGLLTRKNYELGARKLSSNFGSNIFSSLESFNLNPIFTTISTDPNIYYYTGQNTISAPFDLKLNFLFLDGNNFTSTGTEIEYANNIGKYKLNRSSSILLSNGKQLDVILAEKDWDMVVGSGSSYKNYQIVKFDENNNLLLNESPYVFNNNGRLVKNSILPNNAFFNYYNTDVFEALDFIGTTDNNEQDFRLFFKILDNETEQTETLPSGSTITIDKYKNNSGSYTINLKAERDTYSINGQNTNSLLKTAIQPIIEELDGRTVTISKPSQQRFCDIANTNSSLQCYKNDGIACSRGSDCYQVCEGFANCMKNGDSSTFYINRSKSCANIQGEPLDNNCISENSDTICQAIPRNDTAPPACFKKCGALPAACIKTDDDKAISKDKLCTSDLTCYTQSTQDCINTTSEGEECHLSCEGLSAAERKANNCVYINSEKGFVTRFYKTLVSNSIYKTLVRMCLILALTFYGFGYLLGLTSFTQSELLTKLLKVGFIYLMIGEGGWNIYNATFVKFFKSGIDYLVFSVAGAFDQNNTLDTYLISSNFYDKSVLFASVDKTLMLIFSPQMIAKVFGLTFVSIFGIFYVLLIVHSIFLYVFAVANAVLLYLTAQVFISVLLSLGPIFFILFIFEKTKGMFDKWINNLMSFALQQIFLLSVFSFFNILIYDILKFVLSYKVCWSPILILRIPTIGTLNAFSFWRIVGSRSSNPQVAGANFPGLFHVLIIYIIAKIMKEFIMFVTQLAEIKDTLSITGLSGGIRKDAQKLYGKYVQKRIDQAKQKAGDTAVRILGGTTDKQIKEGRKMNKIRKKAVTAKEQAQRKFKDENPETYKTEEGRKKMKAAGEEAYKNTFKKAGISEDKIPTSYSRTGTGIVSTALSMGSEHLGKSIRKSKLGRGYANTMSKERIKTIKSAKMPALNRMHSYWKDQPDSKRRTALLTQIMKRKTKLKATEAGLTEREYRDQRIERGRDVNPYTGEKRQAPLRDTDNEVEKILNNEEYFNQPVIPDAPPLP